MQSTESFKWFFAQLFLFYHWFKWNDLNQSTLTRNSWTLIQTFCAFAISLNANKFITPVPVYEMKYLLKCQFTETASLVILLTLMTCMQNVKRLYIIIIYLFHWWNTCSITMFTVNSLHIWWNSNATFTLCQSALSNLWHSISCDFWFGKGWFQSTCHVCS